MFRLSDDTDDFRFKRAVKEQELACQQDYVPALYSLGIVYHRGNRIKGKEQEGLSMILRAAEREYIPALQYMMRVGPEKVYPIIKHISEKDDAEGEVFHMLSQYYREGVVVDNYVGKTAFAGVNLLMPFMIWAYSTNLVKMVLKEIYLRLLSITNKVLP